jgi:hypothetical protein
MTMYNGSVSADPAAPYLDLDTGKLSASLQAGDDLDFQWISIAAINGAKLAELSGSSYSSLSCARLKGLTYGATSVPIKTGEVFAAKLPSGRYVKVIVTATQPAALRWVDYKP